MLWASPSNLVGAAAGRRVHSRVAYALPRCKKGCQLILLCHKCATYQLYLPREWAEDTERRENAGIPDEVRFTTKTEIALQQLESLLAAGAPKYCVLADAGYGVDKGSDQDKADFLS